MGRTTDDYARQPIDETLRQLRTDRRRGLEGPEVGERLARFGYNEIEEREEALWHQIFRRFWGPIPWMIEVAALLSALVRKWEDFVIICIMLVVNAGLDFFQEHRALNALKALKQRMTAEIIVLRDGAFKTIAARELVPGDVIRLRNGNIVPADVQLLEGDYLLLDQSALTGESLPVSRRAGEAAYASTIVKQGEMLAVVVNTGAGTNFHTVVALVAKASLRERSHFQKMVIRIGDFLILITVALVAVIVIAALFRHEPFLEIVRFALVLTVASIPVALPAVLSVTMAVGAVNLARRQAIVSKLTAIEELAGVDVFCSDKTGTLTRNEMQVAEPVVRGGFSERDLFQVAALASKRENRDPIELPIFAYIEAHIPDADWKTYTQLDFTPFDPVSKRTEARIERGAERFVAMKGAAQVLLGMARLSDDEVREVNQTVDRLAAKGYRTLAVGRRQGGAPLELLGLIPLYDPPREDSREVIDEMRHHGVEVKMVTGDNLAIAREIGRLLGLQQGAMRPSQLSDTTGGAAAKLQAIESVDIFAEVVPEDKYRIVDTLQKAGHIVAMTGDGVNDAPALKKADCGIAVSNATDAARAAADIILTAPGLGVINEAVKQARITFERMKSYSIFRIAETLRIILFMTLAIVVFNFYPITALMIIILALLNDIPILAIAYDHTRVDVRPVRWNMREMLTVSSVLGATGVVSSFLLFYILMRLQVPTAMIQSLFFAKLVVAGHGTIYNTRIDDWFWRKPYPSALLFVATFSTRVLGTLIAVYGLFIEPVGWTNALWMWLYALAWFVINDVVKMGTYRLLRPRGVAA
jgi:H+-transporting ATPase